MSKTFKLKDFEPKGSHHIFLDANILIYAFAPLAEYKINLQEEITRFLELSRKNNTSLYVTSLVLSEVYNVLLSTYFESWKIDKQNTYNLTLKKDYRPTQEFAQSIQSINSVVSNILKLTTKFPDNFHNSDNNVISEMCYNADYNDCVFLDLANKNGWMIFTRDYDIIKHPLREIDVITNLPI